MLLWIITIWISMWSLTGVWKQAQFFETVLDQHLMLHRSDSSNIMLTDPFSPQTSLFSYSSAELINDL